MNNDIVIIVIRYNWPMLDYNWIWNICL